MAFVLSGAAGLVYESIWSRYLGLLVGHAAYAQVLVLVIFMGGMAAGALAVGRRAERLKNPLRSYAIAEAAIGLIGFAFHPAYVALTGLAYDRWFPALGETAWLPIAKWGLAGAMILPQSILLGATFPLLSAGALRLWPGAPGRVVALLYFANSLGGAAGVLAGGFWMVEALGLPGTVAGAAVVNLVVAAAVLAIERRTTARAAGAPAHEARAALAPRPNDLPAWLARLVLAVSFGTAVASFVYEIAWIRMLSLVLGAATHSFELMLSAFILGLALGALWIRSRADRFARPLEALGGVQLAMGALALATLPLYVLSFRWMSALVPALQGAHNGYEIFSLARYGICVAVMLPATFCAGMTLPLLTRTLLAQGAGERAIGMVYGVNTLGSILGAALAGLVLMPWLGLEGMLAAGAAVDLALGVALLAAARRGAGFPRRAAIAAAAAALFVVAILGLVRLDRLTLVSGVFRRGALLNPSEVEVVFYRDGRTATVSNCRHTDGSLWLSTNGKVDASLTATWLSADPPPAPVPLGVDESTQILTGLVSLAQAPKATRVAMVGLGSGVSSHMVLGSPHVRELVNIEIEPEILAAARQFTPANRRAFEDPRSSFVVDDARSYFSATQERYDLIVSEPSNPWVSGVSGLFTDEFYRHLRRGLTDQGVLCQWLNLYAVTDDLALSVLAAIQRNFRDYRIYLVSGTDALIAATNRPSGLAPDWSVVEHPDIARDLAPTFPLRPWLDALRITDRAALAPLVARAPVNSDFHPILDLSSERARFERRTASGLIALHSARHGIAARGAPRVAPTLPMANPLPHIPRPADLVRAWRVRALMYGDHPRPGDDPGLPEAFARQQRLATSILAAGPPGDWGLWLRDVVSAEVELHRGTTAYADPPFFEALLRKARATGAPAPVTYSIEWLYAVDRQDYPAAAALTDYAVAAALDDPPWLPAELVFDGGVAAKLAVGDLEGARSVHRALASRVRRPVEDLRTRLLEAHLAN